MKIIQHQFIIKIQQPLKSWKKC